MRKRKLDGKTYYVFTDADYDKVVGAFAYLGGDLDEEETNLQCYGCVDRFEKDCPTRVAMKIFRKDDVCNVRICDEEGLADYIAKRIVA